jgi:hypothetical protein
LKLRGELTSALSLARQILDHNAIIFARHPQIMRAPVRQGVLIEYFTDRWRIRPDQFGSTIRSRGFTGYDDVVEVARHVFVYERTSEEAYRADLLIDCFHVDSAGGDT